MKNTKKLLPSYQDNIKLVGETINSAAGSSSLLSRGHLRSTRRLSCDKKICGEEVFCSVKAFQRRATGCGPLFLH